MVLKFRSPQYVIIFVIYLLKQFHPSSPQNETDSRTLSLFTSTEAPGKSTPVTVASATQNHSSHNNESSIFSGVQIITLLPQNNVSVQPTSVALQVNATKMPTLNSQGNSAVQPTTLAPRQNLTVQTEGTSVAEPTQLATSATAQVTSTLLPTSQPQPITDPSPSDAGVQIITLLPQNNVSVQPTSAALQVNATKMPTLNSQGNSAVQPTTLALRQNLTVQSTGTPVAVQNSTEEPTQLATRATAQVTSTLLPTSQPQPITDPSPSDADVRFAFRAKKYNFDLNLLNKDSEVYKMFEKELSNEFTTNLGQYGVKGVTILFIRPGSVEVTTILTVNDRKNVTRVESALNYLNQTGRIGNIEIVGIFWKSEGEETELCLFVRKENTSVQVNNISSGNRPQNIRKFLGKPGSSSKMEAHRAFKTLSTRYSPLPSASTSSLSVVSSNVNGPRKNGLLLYWMTEIV